ncbi:MAG: CheR family methyltransferase [Anaeromyxobacteraceae bacterium]
MTDAEEAGAFPASELDALLDHLFVRTGLDFRRYARRSVERRLRHLMQQENLGSVREVRAHLASAAAAKAFAERLCVNVTAMFRDPPFWVALRDRVVPRLRGLPLVRVWSAGCATGEEAYSLAILLREAGLLSRTRIYATDVDEAALERARGGEYPLDHMRDSTQAYQRAGGTAAFSDYYDARAGGATMRGPLRRAILFARHNLVTDASFNAFHLVLCRNVLIYFGPALQEQVRALLAESLVPGGVLGVGARELVATGAGCGYLELDAAARLYRRADGDGGDGGSGGSGGSGGADRFDRPPP